MRRLHCTALVRKPAIHYPSHAATRLVCMPGRKLGAQPPLGAQINEVENTSTVFFSPPPSVVVKSPDASHESFSSLFGAVIVSAAELCFPLQGQIKVEKLKFHNYLKNSTSF
ncbi:hypothetical protein CDAR_422971 [Caerostris darwini]|uniref:Uncharacterized protein n=1 Tax=Caerostris darwini TaxID=1538125 RepID=A0AAV4TGE7_9ARAC|nr:hypothetical protein CDAR_422971 [Caerostris darwini]